MYLLGRISLTRFSVCRLCIVKEKISRNPKKKKKKKSVLPKTGNKLKHPDCISLFMVFDVGMSAKIRITFHVPAAMVISFTFSLKCLCSLTL